MRHEGGIIVYLTFLGTLFCQKLILLPNLTSFYPIVCPVVYGYAQLKEGCHSPCIDQSNISHPHIHKQGVLSPEANNEIGWYTTFYFQSNSGNNKDYRRQRSKRFRILSHLRLHLVHQRHFIIIIKGPQRVNHPEETSTKSDRQDTLTEIVDRRFCSIITTSLSFLLKSTNRDEERTECGSWVLSSHWRG